ncbi:MAG: hypothetical protein JWP40_2249 [Blastococcus sp.]|nr:hypothetical protein [Blastococcus sp.]
MVRVSPTTSPGSNPAGCSSSILAADAARSSLSLPAVRCTRPGPPTSVGGPRAESTATMSSPARGGATPARTWTLWPGWRSCHPSAGAKSSTAESSRYVVPRSTTAETVASVMTRAPPAVATTCGSPVRVRVATTLRPDSATPRRGEASRTAPRTAAAPDVTARPASAASTTATPPARRRLPTATAVPAAAAAVSPRMTGESSGDTELVAQTVAATGASRRSTHTHREAGRRSTATVVLAVTRSPASRAGRRSQGRCPARRRAGRPP